ncbi:MAG: hypothetical protein K2N43_06950, partial [Lachnospiraceae bacterium]|nr:hypothetical protein [Lachnospiraceae bacterium]
MGDKRILLTSLTAILVVCGNGCGKNEENTVQELKIESIDGKAVPESADETEAPPASPIEGIISEQSFEIQLDDWGEVYFASLCPSDESGRPGFVLIKNDEIVYTFPQPEMSAASEFVEVSAVAFRDYNMDEKTDVIVLTTYRDREGDSTWKEASIFLQENSDNMFYMDHPELESYRIEGKTEAGPSFYRDKFLEEHLYTQRLTDSISDLGDSWAEYVDYADSMSRNLGVSRQIELFAENREIWAEDIEYADDRYCFT